MALHFSMREYMEELFRRLQQQQQPIKTVFTDLDLEFSSMTPDERVYITTNPAYIKLAKEQSELFYKFLETKFRDEFVSTFDKTSVTERLLAVVRAGRKEYYEQSLQKATRYKKIDEILSKPEIASFIEEYMKEDNNGSK